MAYTWCHPERHPDIRTLPEIAADNLRRRAARNQQRMRASTVRPSTEHTRLAPTPSGAAHDPGREVADGTLTCPTEAFLSIEAAQAALLERRARASLSGSPSPIERVAFPCPQCGLAHITRESASQLSGHR